MDIGQTFLHQSEDNELHIAWQSPKFQRNVKLNGQTATVEKALYVPGNGGIQPVFIQQGWMQQVGGRADLAMQLLNRFLDRFDFRSNVGSVPSRVNATSSCVPSLRLRTVSK
jgi:hypothetical protein